MKKQDLLIIAVLFALLMGWPFVYKRFFESKTAPQSHYQPQTQTSAVLPQASAPLPAEPVPSGEKTPLEPGSSSWLKESISNIPGQLLTISNADFTVVLSSRGGGIVSATLDKYRRSVSKDSGPEILDFPQMPALTYSGLDGSAADGFSASSQPGSIRLECAISNGLKLIRTIELNDKYQVVARDLFTNTSATAQSIPKHAVQLGPMCMSAGDHRMSGMDYLGIDVLAASGGEGVVHWAGKLTKLFKTYMKEHDAGFMPKFISKDKDIPVDWVAVKNKFFVQILVPEGGAAGYSLMAERVSIEGEDENPSLRPKNPEIKSLGAAVILSGKTLESGQSFCQTYKLYIGPKKYSMLRTLGLHQEDVMDFGMWSPVCKFLLTVLNLTYSVIPNYGVAIIVLTILIRIIFWPLTHKSTVSMKKMQELQPLMGEIRKKYKDSPKKMQEETMALYRKNKVNPMSGCLPMLIQIPVFIALFVVLRSAVELRFAPFLWISDLSAPERLFANILPIPLNILPIFMAATQAWQQTLMPATDPNQQKMMVFFMPALMLVMFYMMPSALVLYWSTNQCIVIVQQLIQKKKAPGPAPVNK